MDLRSDVSKLNICHRSQDINLNLKYTKHSFLNHTYYVRCTAQRSRVSLILVSHTNSNELRFQMKSRARATLTLVWSMTITLHPLVACSPFSFHVWVWHLKCITETSSLALSRNLIIKYFIWRRQSFFDWAKSLGAQHNNEMIVWISALWILFSTLNPTFPRFS